MSLYVAVVASTKFFLRLGYKNAKVQIPALVYMCLNLWPDK